jgi:hypothetical protein
MEQIDPDVYSQDVHDSSDENRILKWINEHTDHDVQVCDCCGDGD